MGRSIINWGGVTDDKLLSDSDHPLSNKAATAEFLRQQNLMTEQIGEVTSLISAVRALTATITTRGMTQLTTSTNVTDPNASALSGTEKNATVAGSLANQIKTNSTAISQANTNLVNNINQVKSEIGSAKGYVLDIINAAAKSMDTTTYNPGSISAWVGGSNTYTGAYVEVTPTVLPDRPPNTNGCEIIYFKFGFNNRYLVIASPYGDPGWSAIYTRSWFVNKWLDSWKKFEGVNVN